MQGDLYKIVNCSAALACLAALLFCAAGCGRESPASRIGAMNDSNIKRLANLYMAHQIRRGGSGPQDEAAFKQFIQNGMPAHRLEMMRVDSANVDELFVSERDGQPFVVRYGQSGGVTSALPVVFEQQGQAGLRLVAFTDGSVEEVDEARYQQLLQGKQNSAAAERSGT